MIVIMESIWATRLCSIIFLVSSVLFAVSEGAMPAKSSSNLSPRKKRPTPFGASIQRVKIGASVSLNCSFDEKLKVLAVRVKWSRESVGPGGKVKASEVQSKAKISGKYGQILAVPKFGPKDAGLYSCKILTATSNATRPAKTFVLTADKLKGLVPVVKVKKRPAHGSGEKSYTLTDISSMGIELNVGLNGKIIPGNTSVKYATLGMSTTLKCTVKTTNAIEWWKIPPGSMPVRIKASGKSFLEFPKFNPSDVGIYGCHDVAKDKTYNYHILLPRGKNVSDIMAIIGQAPADGPGKTNSVGGSSLKVWSTRTQYSSNRQWVTLKLGDRLEKDCPRMIGRKGSGLKILTNLIKLTKAANGAKGKSAPTNGSDQVRWVRARASSKLGRNKGMKTTADKGTRSYGSVLKISSIKSSDFGTYDCIDSASRVLITLDVLKYGESPPAQDRSPDRSPDKDSFGPKDGFPDSTAFGAKGFDAPGFSPSNDDFKIPFPNESSGNFGSVSGGRADDNFIPGFNPDFFPTVPGIKGPRDIDSMLEIVNPWFNDLKYTDSEVRERYGQGKFVRARPLYVRPGEGVTIKCKDFQARKKSITVSKGTKISWIKLGCRINPLRHVMKGDTLSISRVKLSDLGLYTCYPRSKVGQRAKLYFLVVEKVPKEAATTGTKEAPADKNSTSIGCKVLELIKPQAFDSNGSDRSMYFCGSYLKNGSNNVVPRGGSSRNGDGSLESLLRAVSLLKYEFKTKETAEEFAILPESALRNVTKTTGFVLSLQARSQSTLILPKTVYVARGSRKTLKCPLVGGSRSTKPKPKPSSHVVKGSSRRTGSKEIKEKGRPRQKNIIKGGRIVVEWRKIATAGMAGTDRIPVGAKIKGKFGSELIIRPGSDKEYGLYKCFTSTEIQTYFFVHQWAALDKALKTPGKGSLTLL